MFPVKKYRLQKDTGNSVTLSQAFRPLIKNDYISKNKSGMSYILFLYFRGVVPVISVKTFLKWFSELKPTKRLMVAME